MGAATGNKWLWSLKYRIRDFAIKYSKQLILDRAKKVKSFNDRLSGTVERGDYLAVDLVWWDLERETSERYKGFVVRSKLKRIPNEAVKCGTFPRKEEVRRFLHRYIEFILSPDGHVLRSNYEMLGVFRAHFRVHFARCPDLPVQEFRSYLADFPRLREVEATSCEGLVIKCEVRDALKQVGVSKSPGLDGLPYEVHLRISHMFVPILTDVFKH